MEGPSFLQVRMAPVGPRVGRWDLIGDEAGKILASAWLSPQGKPAQRSCWAGLGWAVWCPHYGLGHGGWKGQAPAGLNALLLVFPVDYGSLELRLGPAGTVPTREVDRRVEGGVWFSSSGLPGSPKEVQLRRECPRSARFLGTLRATSRWVSQGPKIAECVYFLARCGPEAGEEGVA